MTQLLILKNSKGYFRIKNEGYHSCTLQQASVFPLDKVEEVQSLLERLHGEGLDDTEIYKLTINEEPFRS